MSWVDVAYLVVMLIVGPMIFVWFDKWVSTRVYGEAGTPLPAYLTKPYWWRLLDYYRSVPKGTVALWRLAAGGVTRRWRRYTWRKGLEHFAKVQRESDARLKRERLRWEREERIKG